MLSGWKIGRRLGLGFAVVLLAVVAIWVLSALNIRHTTELLQNATARRQTAALTQAQRTLWNMRYQNAQFLAADDDAARKQILQGTGAARQQFEDAMQAFVKAEGGAMTREELALVDEVKTTFARFADARVRWLELLLAGQADEARKMRDETLKGLNVGSEAVLDKLLSEHERGVAEAEEAFLHDQAQEEVALHSLGIVALLLAGALSWLLTRSITGPLADAVASVRKVAHGDLTHPVVVRSRDEVGDLLEALATMQDNLKSLVGGVAQAAVAVNDSSAQLAQGNVDLSQRTEEQASTLEETAGSMEQLTATVNQNADHARQANELAASASTVAVKGGAVVGEVVSTMTGISESSRRIADIIGVIDGIAFQTNILALNAAVEAARAGDQGRGFAVVAAEVRSLAQRSAEAAKEIKALIGASVDKVEAGTKLVDAAGATMHEIVDSVRKVSELIAEIATASQEQSQGIAQVTSAVTQMEQVVQQNASLVEEATAATESMKGQAAELLRRVGEFKLASDAGALPVALAAPLAAPATPPVWTHATAPIRFTAAPAAPAREDEPAAPQLAMFGGAKPKGSPNGEWKEF